MSHLSPSASSIPLRYFIVLNDVSPHGETWRDVQYCRLPHHFDAQVTRTFNQTFHTGWDNHGNQHFTNPILCLLPWLPVCQLLSVLSQEICHLWIRLMDGFRLYLWSFYHEEKVTFSSCRLPFKACILNTISVSVKKVQFQSLVWIINAVLSRVRQVWFLIETGICVFVKLVCDLRWSDSQQMHCSARHVPVMKVPYSL